MNRAALYASVRSRTSGIFGTSLSQPQVAGLEAILDEGVRRQTPLHRLAYILATVYHETAHTMQPVRETLAKTDDGAIAALEKAWQAGKLSWVKTPYWRKDMDGKAWFGRGYVQITHKTNYDKFGISDDPNKALEPATALRILFDGMEKGSFTGRKLSDYINDDFVNYIDARRVVNGTDRAKEIAGYAKAFEKALEDAGYGVPAPEPVIIEKPVVADPENLDKPLAKSKTVWQWLLTAAGAPLAAFGGFDWRVQLAIVIIITAFAVYAIKRRADIAQVYRAMKDGVSS